MAELMSDPRFGGENKSDMKKLCTSMKGSMRRQVDQIKGINLSVSQRSVHNLVQEMAQDHMDTLVRHSTEQKDKLASRNQVAGKREALKQERAQAALKVSLESQAGTRAQEFRDKIAHLEQQLVDLKDEAGDWKSRAESAEEMVEKKDRAGREIMQLLESEQKTLVDKRNALKKKIRNEALKTEKEDLKVDEAKEAANKIDMRRQVVQGQLDMVLKMNARAKEDEEDEEEEAAKAAASARAAAGTGREGPALAGYKPAQAKKLKVPPVGDDDWDEKIQNLIGRFSIPKDLAEKMLLDTNGHAGKAVMNLGLDVIKRPEEAEIRELFNTIDEDGSGTLEA
jgi:chromosome segregation ATPase